MKRLILSFLFLQLALGGFSQHSINGTVIDGTTKETVVGAVVKLEGTSKAVFTDLDGKYTLSDLKAGTYNIEISYISYQVKKIEGIKVNGAVTVDASLDADSKSQLDEVVVAETKITNTENAAVMEMKKSNSIISSVSAAQISKSQDRDAAEVVRRVPGVSIINNRFIMVRGLSDRYNTVWLNDVTAPSYDVNKKSFSFDMIQSGLIDRMTVSKTASPELPGDFAGGMVKIYTTAMPEKTSFGISYQGSYRNNSTGQPYYHTNIYKNDWLGMGAKDRAMPSIVPDDIRSIATTNTVALNEITRSFNNDWGISQNKTKPDARLNVNFNGLVKKGLFKFGSVTAINYANITQNLRIHRQTWDSLKQETDYEDYQSTNIARVGAIQNFAFVYRNQKIEFRNFFNQMGRSQTTLRTSNYEDGPNEQTYAELYEQLRTYSGQLSGTHALFNGKTEYTWTGGYGITKDDMPDYRRLIYTKQRVQPDSLYFTGIPSGSGGLTITNGGRFYSSLLEHTKTFNHNIKQTVKIKNYTFELNAGNYIEFKDRTFSARELGYYLNVRSYQQFMLKYQPIGQIFSPANLGVPGGFLIGENTTGTDSYTAQNKLIATYLSGNFTIGKLRIQGGARYEDNVQSLKTQIALDTINPKITTKYLLPSANLAYIFSDKHILRASYSKTLNRPEFREWAPFFFTDFEFNAGIYGSLFPSVVNNGSGAVLNVCQIQNYDLRYEFYPTAGEYIQIGAFYKTFKDPIQQIAYFGAADNSFTFINGKDATVQGIEIDVRKNLAEVDKWFGIKFFKNLNLVANASLIKSVMHPGSSTNGVVNETTLQGQSPYLLNGGLYYQSEAIGTQVSLLYNVFGSRMIFLGNSSNGSIGETGRQTLDFTISQRIYKFISVTFGVQNLLNARFRYVQDTNRDNKYDVNNGDTEFMSYRMGAYYSAGIKIKL